VAWRTGALDFKQIYGEHSIQQDLAAVNPNYETGAREYTLNCGNCTVAYELRRRGLDVEAGPRKLMSPDEWAGMFEGFSRQKPMSRTKIGVVAEIERNVLSWGEGARGTVYGVLIDEDSGHFFSVEVSDGKVVFVDPQVGKADVRWYFDELEPSSIVFGRLDNLKPDFSIINAVKARGT
jgi:hypothetical protein